MLTLFVLFLQEKYVYTMNIVMILRSACLGLWLCAVPVSASAASPVSTSPSTLPPSLQWTRWPAPSSPVLAARRTATPPVVDGTPNEAVWRSAAWSTAFMDMVDGSLPWLRTEVALLWDATALYVAVRMEEPWLEARIAERDGPVYRDPDFELFIAGKHAYWELEVNARNTLYDVFWIWRDALDAPGGSAAPPPSPAASGFDPARWNAAQRQVMLLSGIGEHRHPRGERAGFIDENLRGVTVAVSATGTLNDNSDTDTGWTVEMAIPWDALRDLGADVALPPSLDTVLSMNLSRFVSRNAQGVALPPLRPAAWTLTRHGVFDSHVPERFAQVVFTEAVSNALPTREELRAVLQAHLSAADRVVLGADAEAFLSKHAAFVARVVAEAPWKDKLTPELVRAYVLPPRVTGEPLEAWQEVLRAELLPVLAGSSADGVSSSVVPAGPAATDLTEAALRVRRWLATRAVPGLSPAWSLGPLALMRGGAGRCEELGILFVCAARAVGIPARIAYTSAWRGADGNHLWVEFWDGAQWVALSPEQADAPPGTGWFYPLLDKAAVVQTRGFGAPPVLGPASLEQGQRLLSTHDGVFTHNRTAAYTATGTLRVHVQSAAPAQSLPVEARAYVFNGGRPRVVAAGRGSDLSFVLGTGSYLLSVTREGATTLHSVTVRSGAVTEHVVSTLSTAPRETVLVNEAHGYAVPVSPHGSGSGAGVPQRPFPPPVPLPLPLSLPISDANMPFADSLYASPELLRQETAATLAAWRAFWGERADAEALTALLGPYVLSGRVDTEPFSHWRALFAAWAGGRVAVVAGNAEATAQNMRRMLAERHPEPEQGSPLTTLVPLAALAGAQQSESAAALPLPDRIWAGLCVAGLRTVGIPARLGTSGLRPGMGGGVWVEYFDGTDWRWLTRSSAGHAADEARRQHGAQGLFQLASHGLNPADVNRAWSLCRVGRGGELFAVPLLFTQEGAVRLPVGEYVLVAGQRDAQGLAQWRAEPVRVE